jgi:hypothetical protein
MSDAESDKLVELINERIQLRAEVDNLRLEALRLAVDANILDEFSDLKPWFSDAQRQGLVHGSSWSEPKTPFQLDMIRSDINSLRKDIQRIEDEIAAISREIRRRTS